ncbi:MAG: hypothetical protein KC449_24375, partial [Anaerolineales bacterium]|nr:hypothetical protein [Anaerolineales bacterium]
MHTFVDQIKPITAYLTWAFSRDLWRSIWLLLVSVPGLLRVGHQILNRGVVEGWFGNTLSLTGISTMTLRGMLIWLAWLRQPQFKSSLLPSERWNKVKRCENGRRDLLAKKIVGMHEKPTRIEKGVLDADPKGRDSEIVPTSPIRQVVELFIWLGTITAVFLLARWLVGWEFLAEEFECGATAVFCQLLPDSMLRSVFGVSEGYAAKLINVAAFVLVFCIVILSLKARAYLDGDKPSKTINRNTFWPFFTFTSLFFLFLGSKVYYTLSSQAPSSRSTLTNGVITGAILLLLLATARPKGKWTGVSILLRSLFIIGSFFGIFGFILSFFYPQRPLEPSLSTISVAVIAWAFLGLWLLESKENPFREKAALQGWLKDRLGNSWLWLSSTFNSSFTAIVEFGLLLLFFAGAAIILGTTVIFLPEGFLDDPEAKFRALFTAVLFISIGSSGRWLLSVVQTENFPDRVKNWHKDRSWQLDILLSLGFFGLLSGTSWFLFGRAMYSDLRIILPTGAFSFILYLISKGRLLNRKKDQSILPSINPKSHFIILVIGFVLLLLAGQIMIQTVGGVTIRFIISARWHWTLGTLFIFLWLLFGGYETETRAHLRVVNAVSWLFGVLNVIFLIIYAAGYFSGKPLDLVTSLSNLGQDISMLVTQNFAGFKDAPKLEKTPHIIELAVADAINLEVTKNLIGIFVISLVLIGAACKESLRRLLNLVSEEPFPPPLAAGMQIERIIKVAERLQQSFIRRFARMATIALSILFSVGLFAGIYLTVQFINTGNSPSGIVGALIGILSWAGRRLLPLIPSNLNPDGGYLLEAATEIRSILHRGKAPEPSMRDVPYFLFGHDHHPTYEGLKKPGASSNFPIRQWYVNTGAWVQSYSGDVRLRREDEDQSIFVEIMVDDVLSGAARPPSLRRWDSK